ncbi:MAG: YidC/Oxa1 family membrane protein insertase [Treponema sp.]|nr:YidC/Oxa1 family membrane protein insertase [Treponema sp.]
MNMLYTMIIYPITQIIEFVFVFSQNLFKEPGVSIICVSGVISLLCLPLYLVAEGWQKTERDIQKRLAPKLAKIKAVFKGDERYMVVSAYYRQVHYHPVYAMRSTFGLFIQIPFFIAAYSYLSHLEALRGASFFFIKDLGKPDMLLPIAEGINLLPVLMTLINCTAGALYTQGLQIKDKIQVYGISLVFFVLLYNSPSGLVLYWTINNVFSLVKNGYLKLPFKKKRLLLCSAISISALLLAYYTLFILHGNPRVRTLITALSTAAGIAPWIISPLTGLAKKIKRIPWKSKESISLFIFSILILWAATGIFLPSMLIGSSPQEFSYVDNIRSPLFFVFNAAVQAFGLFILWPLMIYFLSPEKIKKMAALSVTIISFSALCNIFIFPGNYGPISNNLVFAGMVSYNIREILVNTSVLAVLSVIIFLLYIKGGRKILSFFTITLFAALISFSFKTIYAINAEFHKLSEFYAKEDHKTDKPIAPIFQLSKTGKNVLVIMLDMAASVFVPYIFEESPELTKKYEGFIYYPNTVTFNGWTKYGAPPIFGGYEYTPQGLNNRPDVSLTEKINEALLLMPKLFTAFGFSVTVSDPAYADDNWIPDLRIYDDLKNTSTRITDGVFTDLWLTRNNIVLPKLSETLKRNILWYAIFREVPLAFRQGIYYRGSWCAPFSENRMRSFLNGYAVLDFLNELTGFEPEKDNSAVFITNNTTHEKIFLQEPFYKPQLSVTGYGDSRFGKEDWYHANAAAIKRLSEYFDFLKIHGVYDNTRIILVSDHAVLDNSFVTKTNLPFHVDQFNSFLFIKDFYAKDEFKTDMSFMSTADVPSLAMKELIENPVNPFTGRAVTTNQKNEPLLILIDRGQSKNSAEIDLNPHNTFYVHDNIFEEKNWNRPKKIP